MGQAFDRDGQVLGEAYGETKREVFDKLMTDHPQADEIRIKTLRDKADAVHAVARVANIAVVCHEANRAYCAILDDHSQLPWSDAPQWQRDSAIKGVTFHLEAHARGERPSQSASHESWLEEKRAAGWTYGAVKDAEKKEHPCFVPYDDLPPEQQKKDALFGAIVAALR